MQTADVLKEFKKEPMITSYPSMLDEDADEFTNAMNDLHIQQTVAYWPSVNRAHSRNRLDIGFFRFHSACLSRVS